MSWLFGKKKHHKESPVDSTEDLASSASDDSFVKLEGPGPPNNRDGSPYPSSGLYPFIGGAPTYPAPPMDLSKQGQQADMQPYLSGVPFKLCKQLESNMNNDFEIDRLRADEIFTFIKRIDEQNFEYDFSLEKSVISEMNSANDGKTMVVI